MPTNIFSLHTRVELTVDVYDDGSLKVSYLPSKLSKPMLEKVTKLANMEEWEYKADSSTVFLEELIYKWNLTDVERDADGNPVDAEGNPTTNPNAVVNKVLKDKEGNPVLANGEIVYAPFPITHKNIESLGFMVMRDITRAINNHYGEFMKEGEEKSVDSASSSQEASSVAASSPTGTILSVVPKE